MANLKQKVKFGLDESRILVLGTQVLLGFQYSVVFQKDFDLLPQSSQYLKACGLGLLLLTLALLLSAAPYHQLAARGNDTADVLRFITGTVALALVPFAVSLSIDFYTSTEKVAGQLFGALAAVAALLTALFFWYGLGAFHKMSAASPGGLHARDHKLHNEENGAMQDKKQDASEEAAMQLKDKIDQALTEARVVLPGAQALLGFQFTAMLVEGFDKLPISSKYVHLGSLALIALSTILLMAPAAYHRIAENGEESVHFERLASRLVLASMVPLALGICGDFFVVLRKISGSTEFSVISSCAMLAIFYGLWFGYSLLQRKREQQRPAQKAEFDLG
jgi:hypothetical protein